MSERKPNNLPWIVLGGVCGAVLLGLFALGVYSGASAVNSDVTFELDDSLKPNITHTKTVRITDTDDYYIDDVSLNSLSALKTFLAEDISPVESTQIWVMVDNDASREEVKLLTATISDMGYYFPGFITRPE